MQLTDTLSLKDAIESFPETPPDAPVASPSEESTPLVAEQVETYDELPEDTAARIYGELLPKFDRELGAISKKGLVRVLTALVKVPLVDVYFKMDVVENNVCSVASKLLQCKNIMESSVIMEHMQKAADDEKEANAKKEEAKEIT